MKSRETRLAFLSLVTRHWSLVILLAALAASGCGPRNFENDNDRLRAEVLDLQRQVEQLQEKSALRTAELQALRQRAEGDAQPLEGVTPPSLAAVKLDRYTGVVDVDNDGSDDTVRVYVKPVDGEGRFLVSVGRATVQVVAIREGQPPRTIVERTFTPAEFDAAYRSSFTGTHYTLELQLPSPLPDDAVGPATIQLTFTDPAGATFTEQAATTIERAAAP